MTCFNSISSITSCHKGSELFREPLTVAFEVCSWWYSRL